MECDSSSDVSYYHNDDEDSSDISYEQEIKYAHDGIDFDYEYQYDYHAGSNDNRIKDATTTSNNHDGYGNERQQQNQQKIEQMKMDGSSKSIVYPSLQQEDREEDNNNNNASNRNSFKPSSATSPAQATTSASKLIQHQKEQEEQNKKLKHLQQKKLQILQKLKEMNAKQRNIQNETKQTNIRINDTIYKYNQITSHRKHSLSNYSSIQNKIQFINTEKKKLDCINVLHDVFYIFHRGHFTTINGLRLGMSVPSSPGTMSMSPSISHGNGSDSGMGTNHLRIKNSNDASSHMHINKSVNISSSLTPTGAVATSSLSSSSSLTPTVVKGMTASVSNAQPVPQSSISNPNPQNDVPWHEINAGIGMIALLISTIQSRLHIRSRYTIIPRGSTTKVCFNTMPKVDDHGSGSKSGNSGGVGLGFGSIMNNNNSHQEWDLYYHPTTFSFFAKRHWNAALNILGYCLYEVVEEVKTRLDFYRNSSSSVSANGNSNGTNGGSGALYSSMGSGTKAERKDYATQIMIPYDVELSGDWKGERSTGNVKIGGLDIAFNNDGIAWTKALRCVAVDLKWAIAFVSKYVDL